MRTTNMTTALLIAALVCGALADVYLHNPRGSNNRLNERSANRNNGNRMFDSQNNNRGGYNKGDIATQAFDRNDEQYDFFYYMSARDATETTGRSQLTIEWTNQHGCGGNEHGDPQKLNCQIVLQYMCVPEDFAEDKTRRDCTFECFLPVEGNPTCDADPTVPGTPSCTLLDFVHSPTDCTNLNGVWRPAQVNDEFNCPHSCSGNDNAHSETACGTTSWEKHNADSELFFRDGLNTNRQDYTQPNNNNFNGANPEKNRFNRKDGNIKADRGLHETWEWYDECYRRERNRGLFTADQNLRKNTLGYSSAVFTRQNPNDNRRGYECPEERDYYPYWHPSPWRDIAILTDRLDLCDFYRSESQNVKAKHLCRNTDTCPNCIRYNNEADCKNNDGRWVSVGAHGIPAPDCRQAPWSRVNHLGNGRHGQFNSYNWTLPYLAYGTQAARPHRCVFRLRYNISTDDYDAYRVNSSFNENAGAGIQSPVRQNPNVDIGADNQALRLAINTAQFGRTFQDRSHVFRLIPRPTDVTGARPNADGETADLFGSRNLYNINVRGKRGNIVQTFPSVEYDFVPNQLHIKEGDLVHFQWTGSNTHNNGNPAGDGQAGDAGEGTGGTDRHNVVEMRRRHFGDSFPATWEANSLFNSMLEAYPADDVPLFYLDKSKQFSELKLDWGLRMASAGYYRFAQDVEDKTELNPLLNNAPASFKGGVFRFKRGSYNYMCTRNHNFSNRDQKGVLIVEAPPQ